MSLTSRIQDQKDHITQVKKDLCSTGWGSQ